MLTALFGGSTYASLKDQIEDALENDSISKIVLDIEQTVSSLSGNAGVNASDIITNERTIKTQVVANNGGLVVLGGLIKDDLQQYEQKVPVLGDIPLLGSLFTSTGNRNVKTNLLVFIRATVIETDDQLRALSEQRYEAIRGVQSNVMTHPRSF